MFQYNIFYYDEPKQAWVEIPIEKIDAPEFADMVQLRGNELTILLQEMVFFIMARHTNAMAKQNKYLLN